MDPLTAGLMSGASSLVSGFFSADASAKQLANQQQMQLQSEQFNAAEAEKNRNFQMQMSNSAYQRAAQDMKAAGLNPIAIGGNSASTPGGAQASTGTPGAPPVTSKLAGVGDAIGKAVQTAVTAKTLDKMTQEIANLKTDAIRTQAETALTGQRTETEKEETMRRMYSKRLEQLQIPPAAWSARRAAAMEGLPDWAVTAVERGGYVGNTAADLAGKFAASALGFKRLGGVTSRTERTTNDTSGHGAQTFEERWSSR